MKKLLSLALATTMLLSLAACSSSSSSDTSSTTTTTTTEAAATESTDTAAAEESTATATPTYELKISTTQTDTSMIYEGMQATADRIMEETNGDVKVTIYPASSLGSEEDMIDQALAGMGIAVLTDAGRMSNYVYDMGIFNMAYLVDTYQDGLAIMETATFQDWEAQLIDQGVRIVTFNFYDGARSFMSNKAAETPADLNGLLTRTPGADPYNASISAMGATPYNVGWSEVYNGIQTKAMDACEVQYTSAVSSNIYEVCEYVTKTEHINLFNCMIVGEAWFSTLPADYQEIVLAAFDECAYENALEIVDAQAVMEQTLVDNGMTIIEVDKDLFKDAVVSAYDSLGWSELRAQLYAEAGLYQ